MIKWLLLATALALASTTPANAWNCSQLFWAMNHLPSFILEGYKKSATPEDVAKAKACFASRKRKHG